MNKIELEIKAIIYKEFKKLIDNIEKDFRKNLNLKCNNFLLKQFDENITAMMVFVSSFESKSGNAIENCVREIAKLRFGAENVPTIVNPRNVPFNVDASKIRGQVVVTDINVDSKNGDLRGKIAKFVNDNVAAGKGKSRTNSKVTQHSIEKNLLPLINKYKDNEYHQKPVDLAFFDGKNWNIFEIKAGGNLDSSNAPSNIEKLLAIYMALGISNAKVYFATIYNKDGEGNAWKSGVTKYLAYPEMFLIGSKFWEFILPTGIGYETFTKIYESALKELNLNQKMNDLINKSI